MTKVTTRPVADRPAPSETPAAERMVETFAREHGIRVQLNAREMKALGDFLSLPDGQQRAQAYLGLAAAGVALVPRETPESKARVAELLDAAMQVWAGRNGGQAIRGETPLDRLAAYARAIKQAAQGGPVDDGAVAQLRSRVLADATLKAPDSFERGAVVLPRLTMQRTFAAPEPTLPEGQLPAPASHESIFNHPVPHLRVTEERQRDAALKAVALPLEKIPNTNEPWSARRVAELLAGTGNDKQVLDLTHALHPSDRRAVAEEYARLKGWSVSGQAAIDQMHADLDKRIGARAEIVLRAQLNNPSGQPEAADVIALDLKGFDENDEAITRLIMQCNREQLVALDEALEARYGKGLNKVADDLDHLFGADSLEARRVRFIVAAIRVSGEVSEAHIKAFELREAVRNPNLFEAKEIFRRGGTDENRIFRMLESMSQTEFLAVAAAYKELNDNLWKDKVPGDGGQSGEVRATALYHRLHDDLDDRFGGDDLWLQRLALAARGIQYVPDERLGPEEQRQAEAAHRENLAHYLAVTLRLAGKNKLDQADVTAVMKLMQAESADGRRTVFNGLPTPAEVFQVYGRQFPRENIFRDVQLATEGVTEKIASAVLKGAGHDSAQVVALRIANDPDEAYALLDRPNLTGAERATYLAAVRTEFKKQTGKELRAFLGDKLGRELKLPDGRTIPSRVLILEEHGLLTPAERLVHAIHQRGPINLWSLPENEAVMRTLSGLSPLEKVVAMAEYARIVHPERPFNPEAGQNPLVDDLRLLRGKDVRRAAMIAQIMPQDIEQLAIEVALYLDRWTDPQIDAWIRANVGDPDEFVARNFGDADPRTPGAQRSGLPALRDLVQACGGTAEFAVKARVNEQEMIRAVREMVTDSRGNGLTRMLMDFFGPQGAGLEVYARKVGAAVAEAEHYKARNGVVTEEQLAQVRYAYAELLNRVSQYDQLKGQRVEMVSNVALAIALGGTMIVAPGVSPAVLFGIGAGTKAGVHYAFGERDRVELFKQAVRGGASALLAHFAATQTMPASVQGWLSGLDQGVATIIRGGIAGAQMGAGHATVDWALEGRLQVEELGRRVVRGATVGAATGGAMAGVLYYGQKAWQELFGREPAQAGNTRPDDPVDPTDPRPPGQQPGPDPITRPPGTQPGGPGGLDRPPDVGPGGPGGLGRTPGGGVPPVGTTPPVTVDPPPTTGGGLGRTPGGGTTPQPPAPTPPVAPTPPATDGGLGRTPGGTIPETGSASGGLTGDQAVTDVYAPEMDLEELTGGNATAAVTLEAVRTMDMAQVLAAAANAPLPVRQAIVGARAEGYRAVFGPRNLMPSAAAMQKLFDDARAQGLVVPERVPTTPRELLAMLAQLRDQAGQRATAPVSTGPEQPVRERPGTERPITVQPTTERPVSGQPIPEAGVVINADRVAPVGEPRNAAEAAAEIRRGIAALAADWVRQSQTTPRDEALLRANVVGRAQFFIDLQQLTGSVPSAAEWATLLDHARRSGVEVPRQVPAAGLPPAAHVELLQQLIASLRGTPPQGGTRPAGSEMTQEEADAILDSVDAATDPTPTVTPTTREEANSILDRLDGDEQLAVLHQHAALRDVDAAYAPHLRGALELLLGREPGSLADKSAGDLVALLGASPGPEVQTVRQRLLALQRDTLPKFGYGGAANGVADEATRAAFANAAALFGATARVAGERMTDFAGMLAFAAREVGRPLPSSRSAAEIAALTGGSGALSRIVNDYQGKLGVPVTGRFDAATIAAHRKLIGDRAATEAARQARLSDEEAIGDASKMIETFVRGELDEATVVNLMHKLRLLKDKQEAYPRAQAGYRAGVSLVVNRYLGTDTRRIAQFAQHAAPLGMDDVLDDVLNRGIVAKLDQRARAELGMAMVAQNVFLLGLPASVLDALDSALPEMIDASSMAMMGEGAMGAAFYNMSIADKAAAREALQRATVQKKEIRAVLREDVDFLVRTLLSERERAGEAGQRALNAIAALPPNDPALKPLARALASRTGVGGSAAGVLRELVMRETGAAVASALVVEMYATDAIPWGIRDDFARALAAGRHGGESWYRAVLQRLSPQARAKMHENLLAGGLFSLGVTDDERKLAAELEHLGIR